MHVDMAVNAYLRMFFCILYFYEEMSVYVVGKKSILIYRNQG